MRILLAILLCWATIARATDTPDPGTAGHDDSAYQFWVWGDGYQKDYVRKQVDNIDLTATLFGNVGAGLVKRVVDVTEPQFGADGADGTDDTAAIIAAAAAACGSGAKHLTFPRGTFIVRDDVPLCSGLTVTMDAGTVLYWDTPLSGETHGVLYGDTVTDVHIDCHGGVIRGTNTTATFDSNYQQNHGILFDTSSDNVVTHCVFEDIYGNGALKFAYGSTSSNTSNRNRALGNTFRRCAIYGVVVTSGTANKIIGNTFEDCSAGLETNNTTNVVAQNAFLGNHFLKTLKDEDATNAFGLLLSGRDSDDTGNSAVGNTLAAGYIAVSGSYRTIVADNTLRGNSSTNVLRGPITVSNSAHYSRIVNNAIDGSSFGAAKTDARGLLMVLQSNDVTVAGNTVMGNPLGHGIACRDANRVHIDGNRVRDNAGDGIQLYLTNDDAEITNNQVIDNNIANGANEFGIELDGDSGTTVTRPVLRGNQVISPASDKQGVPVRLEWTSAAVLDTNVLTPRQASAAYSTAGTVTATVAGVPLTDSPNTCAADRNGDEYWDASIDERCVCNSAHTSGARWCQEDGGGCTSSSSCG